MRIRVRCRESTDANHRTPPRRGGERGMSDWFQSAKLGDECTYETRCAACEPNGNCDKCDTIDGRFMEAVNEYASTCDWCSELTMHESMVMDSETQLGYCEECVPKLPDEIRNRCGVVRCSCGQWVQKDWNCPRC